MIYLLLFLTAILFDASLIHNGGNLPGISLFISQVLFLIFVFFALKNESRNIKGQFLFLSLFTLIVSLWFAIFTNPIFSFCFLLFLFLGDIYLFGIISDKKHHLFQRISDDMRFLFYIIYTFFHNIGVLGKIFQSLAERNHFLKHHAGTIFKALISLALLLFIILPLLFSADHIFAELSKKFFEFFFSFPDIWSFLSRSFTILMLFLVGVTLYESLKNSHYIDTKIHIPTLQIDKLYNYIVLGGLNLLYVTFVFIQLKYTLFVDENSFQTLGISYGEYIHSGFYQLIVIAMINYLIYLYFHKKTLREGDKAITTNLYILLISTIVITYSAFSRILLYISVYHLTELRVFVVYILFLIFILFTLTLLNLYRQSHVYEMILYRTCLISFILLGFFNIDKFIAEYNLSKGGDSYDKTYIMGLSNDAIDAKEQILASQVKTQKNPTINLELPKTEFPRLEGDEYSESMGGEDGHFPEMKPLSNYYYNYYQQKAYAISLRYK